MKNSIKRTWRFVETAAQQIIAFKTKYPTESKKISGLMSAVQAKSLLKEFAKAEARELKLLEEIKKVWVRFDQKNKHKIKAVKRSQRIAKTRTQEDFPSIFNDIFA